MSRKAPSSTGFGSDSFLDILCNMVGILVILIVIAGMRVSRAPVVLPDDVATVIPSPPTVLDEPIDLGESATMTWAVEAPPPEIPDLPPPPKPAKLAPLDPPKELVNESSSLQADIVALTTQLSDAESAAQSISERSSETEKLVSDLREQVNAASIDADSLAQFAVAEQQDLASLKAKLLTLETELREARSSAPKVKVLKHTTTPVSRFVSGPEVHLRLSQNKVSVVPIDVLVERLQAQIQRQRDFLLSREYYESSVGPIDGYKMEFTLERAKSTPVEQLNMMRVIKMEVTGWTIRPDQGLVEENTEQALKPGSNFLRTIETAGPSATLTFWVYSDSFEIHRQLQDFAQTKGWRVAARPLPDGIPIAGSPKGSKSLAQ